MTDQERPLSAEGEARVRQMLWEHDLAYPTREGVESWADIAVRLLATLDAARVAAPSDGLREERDDLYARLVAQRHEHGTWAERSVEAGEIRAALATTAQREGLDTRDPKSPQWEDCKVCGGDHWTLDHGPDDGPIE